LSHQERLDESHQLAVAENILTKAFGSPVRLGAGQSPAGGSGRATLLRCPVMDGPTDAPTSVIVKMAKVVPQEAYDPDAASQPAVSLHNEWACLQFLRQLAPKVSIAPYFYGGDRAHGLIVMEDLGDGPSLVPALLSADREGAEAALVAYFRALGHLGAVTCGHGTLFQQTRMQLGAADPLSQLTLPDLWATLQQQLLSVCEAVAVKPAYAIESDLLQVARFHVTPGPFAALSQIDTCPDNGSYDGQRFRFFDFEYGGFYNALHDGARARSNFPSCWCVNRLPRQVIQRVEDVYREEIARGCPLATDDTLFHQEIVKACAFSTLYSLQFYNNLWTEDDTWGIATIRQRVITRFELLSEASAQFDYLSVLGETAQRVAERLQALWLEIEPMPLYPAFRG
jgi:hypothetical protein